MRISVSSKIIKILLLVITVASIMAVGYGSLAAENGTDQALSGLDKTVKATGLGSTNNSLPVLIGKLVGIVLQFVGVAFLLLMIYGGITWMVARGNEGEVTKAKDIIQAAIIGLVIVTAAYAITAYVGSVLTTTK